MTKPALITAKDLGLCLGLPVFAAFAWALPQAAWPGFCRRVAPLTRALLSRPLPQLRAVMAANGIDDSARAAWGLTAEDMLRVMYILRRRAPAVSLNGEAHLQSALKQGKGVVLWDAHFAHASLASKAALSGAGYALYHLSHPRHGFSDSRFGRAVLNPICTSLERRFVRERVVLSPEGATAALRHLAQVLKGQGLVSITVRDTGAQVLEVPLLATHHKLASGALDLALAQGAPILPLFSVRRAGRVECHIEAPLTAPPGPRKVVRQAMAEDYARRLEPWVRAYPEQWFGWLTL